MLGIPELDNMICQQLGRHDLVQCARVSKKWHSLVIPHIWRDLSWMDPYIDGESMRIFFKMIQEGHTAEQRYQELQGAGTPTQAQAEPTLSFVSKYGHWIRLLPSTKDFQRPHEPLLHLIRHCSPDVQVKYFWMNIVDMDLESGNVVKAIVDFTLPRVQRLCVYTGNTLRSSSISKLMDLLDQDSIVLERLDLNLNIWKPIMGKPMENEPKTCTTLKELVFRRFYSNMGTKTVLSMLLRRCGGVEKLQVNDWFGSAKELVQGMLDYMPHLNEISLGDKDTHPGEDVIVTLLSGSRNGWKVVRLRSYFGTEDIAALSKHTSTLELLEIWRCDATLSRHLGQVLSLCAKLHTLGSTEFGFENSRSCARINFKAFIDLDSDTGVLRPWGCEGSLKELKVKITDIPRPDLEEEDDVQEAYPGEAREIQGQVYDRLARFINLETLSLGDYMSGGYSWDLEMSLESGLDKLSGLKKLREVGVLGLGKSIGVEEVQWMAVNWPNLRVIRGLGSDEAAVWLTKNTDIKVWR